jgi:hypothetical protein
MSEQQAQVKPQTDERCAVSRSGIEYLFYDLWRRC